MGVAAELGDMAVLDADTIAEHDYALIIDPVECHRDAVHTGLANYLWLDDYVMSRFLEWSPDDWASFFETNQRLVIEPVDVTTEEILAVADIAKTVLERRLEGTGIVVARTSTIDHIDAGPTPEQGNIPG